jgi:hypothetical protein
MEGFILKGVSMKDKIINLICSVFMLTMTMLFLKFIGN